MFSKPKGIFSFKKNNPDYTGIHLIAEFWGAKTIEDPKKIEAILTEAAKRSHNIPLWVKTHKFSPQGITGIILLAESHISIHTWPEKEYVAVDLFTCGQGNPRLGLEYLKEEFQPKKVKLREIKRGI